MRAVAVVKGTEMKVVLLLFLAFCLLWDVKDRKLPAIWLYAGMGWMIIYALYQLIIGKRGWTELVLSLIPGIVCYLLVIFTHQMGQGDAFLILGMGFCMPWDRLLRIIMAAFFLSAIASILMLIGKRKIQDKRIAFVPFLFCAVLLYG